MPKPESKDLYNFPIITYLDLYYTFCPTKPDSNKMYVISILFYKLFIVTPHTHFKSFVRYSMNIHPPTHPTTK
jgi:hypothetical protein